MPGYHLIEDEANVPEEAERLGFLDFLRELGDEDPAIPRLWQVTVVGLEEVLFAGGQEREELTREIYRRLRAAGTLLERRVANVYILFHGKLQRGADFWSEYRGERLLIDPIFGTPLIQADPEGRRIYPVSFNLTHGG